MIDTPKILNYPGIDQPLREQTLAEFVMVLDEGHLVRRELRELQRRSAEAARLSSENVTLTQRISELEQGPQASSENSFLRTRIKELEADMAIYKTGLPPEPAELTPQQIAKTASTMLKELSKSANPQVIEKIPCRFCQKPIARGKSYWSIHLKKAHPQENAIDSPQE